MFKIGEFSKLTQVSIRMLRYYDEVGLLKPEAVDPFTGYRLYSSNQISTLQRILLLRDLKFSVSEMLPLIKNSSNKDLTHHLEAKKEEIKNAIALEQARIQKLDAAMLALKDNQLTFHCNVTFKAVPSYKVISLRRIVPNYFCEGLLWKELWAYISQEKISISTGTENNLAIYHDDQHKDTGIDIEVAMRVPKLGKSHKEFIFREVPSVNLMTSIMVYGPYENIATAYHSLACWLEAHPQYQIQGESRQICHLGQPDTTSPEDYLTEIQVPVVEILS